MGSIKSKPKLKQEQNLNKNKKAIDINEINDKFAFKYMKEMMSKQDVSTILKITNFFDLILFLNNDGFYFKLPNRSFFIFETMCYSTESSISSKATNLPLYLNFGKSEVVNVYDETENYFYEYLSAMKMTSHFYKGCNIYDINFECKDLLQSIVKKLQNSHILKNEIVRLKDRLEELNILDIGIIKRDTIAELYHYRKEVNNMHNSTQQREHDTQELYKLHKKINYYTKLEEEIPTLKKKISNYERILVNINLFITAVENGVSDQTTIDQLDTTTGQLDTTPAKLKTQTVPIYAITGTQMYQKLPQHHQKKNSNGTMLENKNCEYQYTYTDMSFVDKIPEAPFLCTDDITNTTNTTNKTKQLQQCVF